MMLLVDGSLRPRRVRASRYALLGTFVVSAIGLGALAWVHVEGTREQLCCKQRLGRQLYAEVRKRDDTLLSLSEFSATVAGGLKCCSCNEPFVYRPTDSAVRPFGKTQGRRELFRMVGWCPKACHAGRRVVLLENGSVHLLGETAFQNAIKANYKCENRSVE